MEQHRDEIWERVRAEAAADAQSEPMLASFIYSIILNHTSLEDALSFQLAGKLESHTLTAVSLRDLIDEAFYNDSSGRDLVEQVVDLLGTDRREHLADIGLCVRNERHVGAPPRRDL